MLSYSVIGFIIGFVAGVILNGYLLRDIPRETYMKDRKIRLRYGALNWAIALLGMAIGMAITKL